jgi:hypothetical protein
VARIAAGADLGQRQAQLGDPVHREIDQFEGDAAVLVAGVDGDHVDLAATRQRAGAV